MLSDPETRGLLLLRYPHTTPIKNLLHALRIKNRLYDLPAHLSDFSPGMIEKCLEGAGFTQCQHRMGGYTLPKGIGKHLITSFFGNLGEGLFFLSQGKFLFPESVKPYLVLRRKGREFGTSERYRRKNEIENLLILVLLLLSVATGILAQPMGTDEVIQRLREVRERTKDFTADLLQEKTLAALKQKLVSKGKIRYKYPDKVYVEILLTRVNPDGFRRKDPPALL